MFSRKARNTANGSIDYEKIRIEQAKSKITHEVFI